MHAQHAADRAASSRNSLKPNRRRRSRLNSCSGKTRNSRDRRWCRRTFLCAGRSSGARRKLGRRLRQSAVEISAPAQPILHGAALAEQMHRQKRFDARAGFTSTVWSCLVDFAAFAEEMLEPYGRKQIASRYRYRRTTASRPRRVIEETVEKKVNGVVITASPGPMPSAINANKSASLPEATPTV